MIVRDVISATAGHVRAFLESRIHTSVFLLSCLDQFGPALGPHQNSGQYRTVESAAGLEAVFSLTRRGHLLADTSGRLDLAEDILQATVSDGIRIDGVVAEWRAAHSLWTLLCARPGFSPAYATRNVVYSLTVHSSDPAAPVTSAARQLTPDDLGQWDELMTAFLTEERAPLHRDSTARRASFIHRAGLGYWWGAFDGAELIAIAGLDEAYRTTGQIGGLYTRHDHRGHGFGSALMTAMMREMARGRGLDSLVLFARDENTVARSLYERLGFTAVGHFGLCFGEWR